MSQQPVRFQSVPYMSVVSIGVIVFFCFSVVSAVHNLTSGLYLWGLRQIAALNFGVFEFVCFSVISTSTSLPYLAIGLNIGQKMDVDFPLLLAANFVTFSGLMLVIRYILEEEMVNSRAAAEQGTVDGGSPGWMGSFQAVCKMVQTEIHNPLQTTLFLAAVAYVVFMAFILQADFTQNSDNARRLFAFSLFLACVSTMVESFYPKVCYLLFTFSYAFEGILFIFQMGCPLNLNVLVCCLAFFCAALTLMTYLWGVRALRIYSFAFAATANGFFLIIFIRIEVYAPHADEACSILHLIPKEMVYFWQ